MRHLPFALSVRLRGRGGRHLENERRLAGGLPIGRAGRPVAQEILRPPLILAAGAVLQFDRERRRGVSGRLEDEILLHADRVGGILAGLGFFFGIIAVLLAVLYFAIAYGVWKGRGWAWTVGVVVSIIGLVFGVLGLTGGITVSTIISLALPIVVLYYFMQPEVKRWLGRPA